MHRSETLTEEQLGRLKFVQGSGLMVRPGMYYNVHFVDTNNYEKVEKLFKSYADITTLPKGAKGFILPKNNLKKDDIKEICKRYDLKITNDVSKADFFIGNDHVAVYGSMHDQAVDSRALMAEAYCYVLNYDDCGVDLKNDFINFMSSRSGVTRDHLALHESVMYTKEINSKYEDWTMYANERRRTYITDDGLFIIYNMLSRKIPVVSVDSLFKGIDKVTIDEDIYNTLVMMLRGSDEDKGVAMNMLYNCNINESYYYLWLLMRREVSYVISRYKHRNTKAHKTFIHDVGDLNHTDDLEALEKFKEKGCLSPEIYFQMSEKIIDRVKTYGVIEEVEKNNVLRINIEIIPYEEYMQTKTQTVDV